MFCKNCGKEVSENSKFCISCGTPVLEEPKEKSKIFESSPENFQLEEPSPTIQNYFPQNNYAKQNKQSLEIVNQKRIRIAGFSLLIFALLGFIYSKGINKTPDINSDLSKGLQQTSDFSWETYTAPDGSFTALFPGTPEVTSSPLEGNGFTATMKQYNYSPASEIPFYNITVGFYSFAAEKLSESEATTTLKAAVDGMVKASACSLISSTSGSRGDFFTMDFLAKGTLDGTDFYLVGRGLMKETNKMFIVLMADVTSNPVEKDKFVNSFNPK